MLAKVIVVVAGMSLLLATVPASAHHAFASEFDGNKLIYLDGTVTKVEWINPHSWIHMDVKRPDGTVESWTIEMGTPGSLLRRGLTKDHLPSGTEIKVEGFRAKDDSNRVNGRTVTFAGGRAVGVGSPNTGAPDVPTKR